MIYVHLICVVVSNNYRYSFHLTDISSFSLSAFSVFSWSCKGLMASSFGDDLVMWYPPSEDTLVFNIPSVKALAFSPDGEYLAAASDKDPSCRSKCDVNLI